LGLGNMDGQTTVEGYLNGDGITFGFVFALRPVDGGWRVSGLALNFEVIE